MKSWSWFETFVVLAIGKRLWLLMVAVAGYCIVTGLVIQSWDIRLFVGGSAASVINTVILGLLLSFRNRTAYDRWWEARGLWGQLVNDTRNLSVKLAAYLPVEQLVKSHVAESLIGFAVALKQQLRDESPRLRDLPGFARETDDPEHVPLYLARRLHTQVAEWKHDGYIDDTLQWILDPHLRGLIDVCGGCEKIRNTPISPSYKSLLRIGLIFNVLAEPWLTMREFGFWGVPVFEVACFFLLGIEMIDSVVEEPFGRERDDLDLDRYCQTIREGVEANLPLS